MMASRQSGATRTDRPAMGVQIVFLVLVSDMVAARGVKKTGYSAPSAAP